MILLGLFLHVSLALFAVLAGTSTLPATDPVEQADEKLLQNARVGTDGPSLLTLFRRRTPTGEDEQRLRQLVRQLGNSKFAVREKASRELVERGPAVLRLLREALTDPDKEIVRRATTCIAEIESTPALPAAAARLVVRRDPAGAVGVLLTYLPFADDASVEEEVLAALVALGTRPGKVDPALTAALKDSQAIRRAAAAHVLGRHPEKAQREAASRLLADQDPVVRLRAAQGLIAGKDPQAVPALIALVGEAPASVSRQAEETLWRLAGDRSPPAPADGNPATNRRDYQEAWSRWWRDHSKGVDFARLVEQPAHLGLTIICQSGKVWECGRDGKPRWTLGDVNQPIEAMMLPGNRVLITENLGRRITERDLQGKIYWEHKTDHEALSARRLPNGNTFISTNNSVYELTRDGKEVYRHKFPAAGAGGNRINSACKLRNGRLLVLTDDGSMAEVDAATGKVLVTRQAPDHGSYSTEPLPGGGWLVAAFSAGKAVEYDAAGKLVWEYTLPSAFHATRLPSGNTLIASHSGQKIVEVTRAGKVVGEQQLDALVWRAHRR